MACSQLHFDVAVVEHFVLEAEPQQITLAKTSAVHILNGDPCSAPVDLCIQRVVKCQKGCRFDTIMHDFPIDSCDPILPPGLYEVSVKDGSFVLLDNGVTTVDVIFEDVTPEYVQAIIANKAGGCCES